MKSTFDRWLLGAVLLIALLVSAIVLTYQNTRRLNEDASWVTHTHEVLDALAEVSGNLRAAEGSQRTNLIVGGDVAQSDFAARIDNARQMVRAVETLTHDNKIQQERIPDIHKRINNLEAFWTNTMSVRKEQGFNASRQIIETGESRRMLMELEGRIQQMEDHEHALLRDRSAKRERAYNSAIVGGVVSGTVSVAGVVCFLILLRRHMTARAAATLVIAEQRERLRTTLASIGDGVISTDSEGRITNMNAVAESLTGWTTEDATGQSLQTVFNIVNEETRRPVANPAARVLRDGVIVGLANHTILIARDGTEWPIDDSAAPIRCQQGEIVGCVLVFRDVTERRRMDRANSDRLATARLLASIVESSNDAVISKSLDGTIQTWNTAAERLFDYSAAQAIGHHISLIIPPDRVSEEEQIIASLRAGQRIEHYDTVRLRRDGTPMLVSLTISPIRDEDGRVIGASKIVRDITSQREVQRERQLLAEAAAANAKFRAFFDQGAMFAGIMALDGTILEPNRLSWEGCGYTREQIVGKPFWDGPWWTSSAALVERIKDACMQAAAGQTFRAEVPYFVADGSERVADVMIVPIKDDAGRILFLAPTGADITERKKAEEERQMFVTLVENSSDFIGICDMKGVPIFINRAGLKMVGLDGIDQARQTHVKEFFFPEDQAKVMEEFFPTVLKSGYGELEVRFRNFKTYEARWMSYKVLVINNGEGQTVGIATVSQDVTERRRMEESLRELAADLSEADRRKDEFLATLAHELRNPLAPIRNALNILEHSPSGEPAEQARALMGRQLEQMVRLVDDLLDVSRITRGRLELRRDYVPLSAVVNSAVEISRPLITQMGHELTVDVPQQSLIVNADLTRLAQVFSNLLNNSAKYMDRGGHIWMKVEQQGGEVVVSVRDEGIGIAADQLPRIFEMFSQVDNSTERTQGGLGIGLTLVKRLVEMHGGTIEAASEGLGRGAEFTVRLPVVILGSEPQSMDLPEGRPPTSSSLRILVVDDNSDSANSLSMLMRIMGHETRAAYDGLQALELADQFRPDVVLLDIGMPELSGHEACRRIRESQWGAGVVLVAVTGWGQEADRRRSREAGFDHHMVKPVDVDELTKLLAGIQPMTSKSII